MGFREPLTTAEGVDTGDGLGAGVRVYGHDVGGFPQGVVEFYNGYTAPAQWTATPFLTDQGGGVFTSVGSSTRLEGLDDHGIAAPALELNVEEQPAGGYAPVARLTAHRFVAPAFMVQAYATSVQTLTSGAWSPLGMHAADVNVGGFGVGVGGVSRIVVPVDGYYLAAGGCHFAANTAGRRGVRWLYSQRGLVLLPPAAVGDFSPPSGNVTGVTARPVILRMFAGDWLELQGLQDSGGNLDTFVAADSAPAVTVHLLQAT